MTTNPVQGHNTDPASMVMKTTIRFYLAEMERMKSAHQKKQTQSSHSRRAPNTPVGDTYLTPREADCVKLVSQGKKYKETAKALSLSLRTVEFYIQNVKKKFNCRNKKN